MDTSTAHRGLRMGFKSLRFRRRPVIGETPVTGLFHAAGAVSRRRRHTVVASAVRSASSESGRAR